MITKQDLAKFFHETYERLAPSYGYTTRPETRELDFDSPNGQLMVVVCKEVLEYLAEVKPQGSKEYVLNNISKLLCQLAAHWRCMEGLAMDGCKGYPREQAEILEKAAVDVEELCRAARQMDVTLEVYANLFNPPSSEGLATAHKALIGALKPFRPKVSENDK